MPKILKPVFGSRALKIIVQSIVVVSAVILFITFFGSSDYQVQGIAVKVYVKPSMDGYSHLKLPPLGVLSADTHQGPVDLFIELTEIHPEVIDKGFSLAESQEDWIGSVQSEVKKHMALFLLKQVLVGAAGAALIFLMLFRPGWKRAATVFLISVGLAVSVLGYSAATYDVEAFKQPQYKGVIAAGPELLLLADKIYDKYQNFKDTTEEVVMTVNTLFTNLDGLDSLIRQDNQEDNQAVKILVVSDISNNPVGVQLVKTLANSFKVDMVIDAGDLTDFGSPLEAQAFNQIGDLGVPYLFAPGNHDSPEVMAFLRRLPNVSILDGSAVNAKGLTVLGVPDPWSYVPVVNGSSEEEIQRQLEDQLDNMRAKLTANDEINIAVIHNPTFVDSLAGLAPVVISGHTHKLSVKEEGGTIFLNPGTTGASGFRGLQAEEMSYSALILHYGSDINNKAVVDIIEFDPLSSSITAQRRLFKDQESADTQSTP